VRPARMARRGRIYPGKKTWGASPHIRGLLQPVGHAHFAVHRQSPVAAQAWRWTIDASIPVMQLSTDRIALRTIAPRQPDASERRQ
jgi:hypothetical protein